MMLNIADTMEDSIVDGNGIRFTIFVQGCPHHCPGCHNPQTHDFSGGKQISTDALLERIQGNLLLDGVTFSGGEPFCQAAPLAELAAKIHALGGLDIVTYTGYTFETLLQQLPAHPDWLALLQQTDILIDGPFLLEQKSYDIRFRGSTNQRYLDCPESLRQGIAVEAQL